MKKKWTVSFIITLLVISSVISGFAYNRDKHDDLLQHILLGPNCTAQVGSRAAKALDALKRAAYLTIDQFNDNGTNDFVYLKEVYRVPNMPASLDDIKYSDGPLHGRYSHLGWNHNYDGEAQVRWEKRKKILLEATEKIFNFSILPTRFFGYDKRCDSFAALVYYIHVIADYEAGEEHDGNLMPLVVAAPTSKNPDIIYELIYHFRILFDDQDSYTYGAMMGVLQDVGNSARSELAKNGSIDTQSYANKLMEKVLKEYVYKLLRNEPFFKKVFY